MPKWIWPGVGICLVALAAHSMFAQDGRSRGLIVYPQGSSLPLQDRPNQTPAAGNRTSTRAAEVEPRTRAGTQPQRPAVARGSAEPDPTNSGSQSPAASKVKLTPEQQVRVQRLVRLRQQSLREVVKARQRRYESGVVAIDVVYAAWMDLFTAELEHASPNRRSEIRRKTVNQLRQLEQIELNRAESRVVTTDELQWLRARRLKAEIDLEWELAKRQVADAKQTNTR